MENPAGVEVCSVALCPCRMTMKVWAWCHGRDSPSLVLSGLLWGAFTARCAQAVPGPQTLLLAAALNTALEKAGLPRVSPASPHNS